MNSIRGLAEAERLIGPVMPFYDFRFMRRIHLDPDDIDSSFNITLWLESSVRPWRLTVRFRGVKDLKLERIGWTPPVQLGSFRVNDWSSRNWEGVSWNVEDYEEGMIDFNCAGIEIVAVEQAAKLQG